MVFLALQPPPAQAHALHGLAGDAILHGEHLHALVPLLRILAVTGVGKATSLGLGVVRMVPQGARDPLLPSAASRRGLSDLRRQARLLAKTITKPTAAW